MATMTDAEKKTAVLIALVKAGILDLSTFADGLVRRLPADFDPNNPTPELGGSGGSLVGPWYVLIGAQRADAAVDQ